MVGIAVFLIGGILLGPANLLLLGLGACALAALHYFVYKRKIAFLFPIFALIGAVSIANATSPRDLFLEEVALRAGFVRVEGTVEDISFTRTGRQRVKLRGIAFTIGPSPDIYHPSVPINILTFLPEGQEAALGQRLVAGGYLLTLDEARNPGAFNEFQFHRSRGIDYKMFAESVTKHEVILTPAKHIRNFGVRLSAVFERVLPPQQAGIMQAMIVGDRSGLDRETRDIFREVGMFHILVVSGLHVNILATFFAKALEKAKVRLKPRSLLVIAFLICFCILTGAGVATVRATIMGIALVMAGLLGFEHDTPTSLCIAAVGLLLFQPLFLFDVGFIYSFSAVLALSLGTKPIGDAIRRFCGRYVRLAPVLNNWYARRFLPQSLAVTLAYIPLHTYFFFGFSPIAFLINFLLLPSVFVVIILGFCVAMVGLVSTGAAAVLAAPLSLILNVYDFVMRLALRLPFASVITGRPGLPAMLLMIGGGIFLIYTLHKGTKILRNIKILAAAASIVIISQFALLSTGRYINVTFLYVGQGDSAVLSRGRSGLIIDGGGVFGREVGENVGMFTLIPYLNYRGISRAVAVATHNDRDHALGIAEALLENRISHLILASANSDKYNPLYYLMTGAAKYHNVPITYVAHGDVLEFYGMRLYVLFPYDIRLFAGNNNNSMIIRAVYGDTTILFTADIEGAAEAHVLAAGRDLNACLLKVAHHGSRTSTSREFLEAVDPQMAVISAGRNNMFGHPHDSVTGRLDYHNVPYLVTARHGAVLARTNGRRIIFRTMRD